MDPTATLIRLIDAVRDRETPEITNAAEDLADWMARGGFAPDLHKVHEWLGSRLGHGVEG